MSLTDDILQVVWHIFLHPKIDTLFFALFEDFQTRVSDSKPDISANSVRNWNIYIPKSKLGYWQSETNKILKIEVVAIVSWLVKHFVFFYSPGMYVCV